MAILKNLIRNLVYYVYWALPKFNYAVIYGSPDFEDNSLALQAGLNETTVRKVILLVTGGETGTALELGTKTIVVRKNSLRGIFCFLFARYVFFTHRCFMFRFPSNVVSVNVWHGMPIKRIGWMLKGNRGYSSKYSIATSEFWAEIIQKSLRPFAKTLVTGLPRNDRLFLSSKNFRQQLGLPAEADSQKIIAWLPTYRKSVFGEIRMDGRESGNVFGISGLSPELLNDFLKQHDSFAIVKPHPMAHFEKNLRLSNLLIVDDDWLRAHKVTLYEMLGQCDALVSDISSVVVDYLALNRPVIHLLPDLQEYRASRGFSIEPVTDYLVGPVVTTAEELFDQLARTLKGEDSHLAQRERIQKLFLRDNDRHSTKRLLQELGLSTVSEKAPAMNPAPQWNGIKPSSGLLASAWNQLKFTFFQLSNLISESSLLSARQSASMRAQLRSHWKAILVNSLLLAVVIWLHFFYWNRHMSFTPLYLVPCVMLALRLDCRWAAVLATVAAVAPPLLRHWQSPDFLSLQVALLNMVMRFILFQIVVVLAWRIRGQSIFFRRENSEKTPGLAETFAGHWAVILATGLFFAGVVVIDVVTSPQLNLLPLYLLPCIVLALVVNRRWGAAAAVITAVTGPLAMRFEAGYAQPFAVEFWNTVARLVIFQLVVLLVDRIRRDSVLFCSPGTEHQLGERFSPASDTEFLLSK